MGALDLNRVRALREVWPADDDQSSSRCELLKGDAQIGERRQQVLLPDVLARIVDIRGERGRPGEVHCAGSVSETTPPVSILTVGSCSSSSTTLR